MPVIVSNELKLHILVIFTLELKWLYCFILIANVLIILTASPEKIIICCRFPLHLIRLFCDRLIVIFGCANEIVAEDVRLGQMGQRAAYDNHFEDNQK